MYVLVAGPLPPGPELPDVDRLTVTPPIVTAADALAENMPLELLLIVREHVATLPLTPGLPQSSTADEGDGATLVVIEKLGLPLPLWRAVTAILKAPWSLIPVVAVDAAT